MSWVIVLIGVCIAVSIYLNISKKKAKIKYEHYAIKKATQEKCLSDNLKQIDSYINSGNGDEALFILDDILENDTSYFFNKIDEMVSLAASCFEQEAYGKPLQSIFEVYDILREKHPAFKSAATAYVRKDRRREYHNQLNQMAMPQPGDLDSKENTAFRQYLSQYYSLEPFADAVLSSLENDPYAIDNANELIALIWTIKHSQHKLLREIINFIPEDSGEEDHRLENYLNEQAANIINDWETSEHDEETFFELLDSIDRAISTSSTDPDHDH